jgi:collagenase-like PrtC family protease
MATSYTLEMLHSLEAAIATGARECYYGDKRVSYRSLDEMRSIANEMRTALGVQQQSGKTVYPEYYSGL